MCIHILYLHRGREYTTYIIYIYIYTYIHTYIYIYICACNTYIYIYIYIYIVFEGRLLHAPASVRDCGRFGSVIRIVSMVINSVIITITMCISLVIMRVSRVPRKVEQSEFLEGARGVLTRALERALSL